METFQKFNNTAPIILGTDANKVPVNEQYAKYIAEKIGQFDATLPVDELQNEIWRYGVLDELGYIERSGDATADFHSAETTFLRDFYGELDILDGARILESYMSSRLPNKTYIRKRSDGRYLCLQNGKLLCRTADERALVDQISKTMLGNEAELNVFFDGFETIDKMEACLMNIERLTTAALIRGGSYKNFYLLERRLALTERLDNTIGEGFGKFQKKFSLTNGFLDFEGVAESENKNAVTGFITEANAKLLDRDKLPLFSDFTKDFVKTMKKNKVIKTYRELKISIATKLGKFIWVRTKRNNRIEFYES